MPRLAPWLRNTLIIGPGVVSGVVMFVEGIALSGLGHGWSDGALLVMSGLMTAPLGALAWIGRRRWIGRVTALVVVLYSVLLDMDVIGQVLHGSGGFPRVWRALPGDVITSAVLVALWQLPPVAVVVIWAREVWTRRARAGTSTLRAN